MNAQNITEQKYKFGSLQNWNTKYFYFYKWFT